MCLHQHQQRDDKLPCLLVHHVVRDVPFIQLCARKGDLVVANKLAAREGMIALRGPKLGLPNGTICWRDHNPNLASHMKEIDRVKIEIFTVAVEHCSEFVSRHRRQRRVQPRGFRHKSQLISMVWPDHASGRKSGFGTLNRSLDIDVRKVSTPVQRFVSLPQLFHPRD